MKGVFVSYRRSDSSGHAGRIHDRLVEYYGDGRVFRDLEDIAAGDDFVQTIRDTLAKKDVLLVIIGPSWLNVTDDSGGRRLDNPRDIVRLEVAEALGQRTTRVIPVLVNGAAMPRAEDLPAPLATLATRNAFEVLDTRFADDVTRLIKTIGGQPAGRARKIAIGAGFGAILVAATGTLLAPILAGPAEISADVNVYHGGGTIAGSENDALLPIANPDTSQPTLETTADPSSRAFFAVSYSHQRQNRDNVAINAAMPYLDLLLSGGPVSGEIQTLWWEWPRLSIQIVNNSDETLYVSGVEIEIRESVTDTEPLILVRDRSESSFDIVNYGWGDALNPRVEIAILPEEQCDRAWVDAERTELDLENARLTMLRSNDIEGPATPLGAGVFTVFDVRSMLTPALTDRFRSPCVFGLLTYTTEDGEPRTVRFKTTLAIRYGTLASVLPTNEYFVYLPTESSGETKTLSVDHEIQPNSVEHFLIRVGTNKSGSFDLGFRIQTVGRDPVLADNVQLSIIAPMYDPDFRSNPERRR